ncbi:hypothetical protein CR513_14283, partial [Mucuna pruriens]
MKNMIWKNITELKRHLNSFSSPRVVSTNIDHLFFLTQDLSTPYYIYPNENHSLVLISLILETSNYHHWSKAILCLLMAQSRNPIKETLHMLLGHDFFHGLLTHGLILPKTCGKNLRINFCKVRISKLHQEFYFLKQGEVFVIAYFTKLKILWVKFATLDPSLHASSLVLVASTLPKLYNNTKTIIVCCALCNV